MTKHPKRLACPHGNSSAPGLIFSFASSCPVHLSFISRLYCVRIPSPLRCFCFSMYSSSNSFLGGANSARPGQPPFAQQPPYSQFPPNQQPSHLQPGFTSQPTGYNPQLSEFGGSSLQPQSTGFAGGQVQPQFTGFPGATPQQMPPQPNFQPPTQQPQFTGHPHQNQTPQLQLPQNTGLPSRPAPKTSSEIANSFQDGYAGAPQPPPKPSASKVPSIRLSFITAQDQAKFEQLFKSAVGDSQTMDG